MNGWVDRSSIQVLCSGCPVISMWVQQTGWKRGLTLYSKNKLHKFEKLSAVHVKERRKG